MASRAGAGGVVNLGVERCQGVRDLGKRVGVSVDNEHLQRCYESLGILCEAVDGPRISHGCLVAKCSNKARAPALVSAVTTMKHTAPIKAHLPENIVFQSSTFVMRTSISRTWPLVSTIF